MKINIYQQALDSQTACNLSGLCMSLPKIAQGVWDELRNEGQMYNVTAFNNHPVMRLIAEQFQFLTACKDYSQAATECERGAVHIDRQATEAAKIIAESRKHNEIVPQCNGCDTIDAFCRENAAGYCRECYAEVTK